MDACFIDAVYVYKWSAPLTVAAANCYWWLKVCWKRLMPLTHRPLDSWLTSDMQSILHFLVCLQGWLISSCHWSKYGNFGTHICPCGQIRWCDTEDCPRIFFFLPHSWESQLSVDWWASSVVEITGISIYLSVLVSKSQNTTFKKRRFQALSGTELFWHCTVFFKTTYPSAELA